MQDIEINNKLKEIFKVDVDFTEFENFMHLMGLQPLKEFDEDETIFDLIYEEAEIIMFNHIDALKVLLDYFKHNYRYSEDIIKCVRNYV